MRRKHLLLWIILLAGACASPAADSPESNPNGGMKKFIVMLEGRNFIFDDGGEPTRFGFSTTRNVEAMDAEEAERRAMQEVDEDDRLNGALLNDASSPPRVTITRTVEVESFDPARIPELDYIFYKDHDTP